MTVVLAHISDLHLPPPERIQARALASKRFFSWTSWGRSRRHIHRPEAFAALVADVRAHAVDHLLVTGDITNLALPEEFAAARDWLAAAGPPEAVTAVPGNHDALVPVSWIEGLGQWSPWFGDPVGPEPFPFVKRLGEITLFGVSTAIPTAPLLATGRVGPDQLARLRQALVDTEGLFRIVLLHHPPADGVVSARKALTDRAGFRAVLAEAGAELVLHGHAHDVRLDPLPGPDGPIVSLGIGSASARPSAHGASAGWRRIAITPEVDGWRVKAAVRSLVGEAFAETGRWSTAVPRPQRR